MLRSYQNFLRMVKQLNFDNVNMSRQNVKVISCETQDQIGDTFTRVFKYEDLEQNLVSIKFKMRMF